MIKKITNQNQIARHKLAEKINELVDAINVLQAQVAILEEHAHPTAKTPDYDDTDDIAEVKNENLYTKSMRMDKEFAEDECVRLQGKLEIKQNALEVALAALNTIKPKKDVNQGGFWTLSQSDILDVILRAEKEIKRIAKGGDNE